MFPAAQRQPLRRATDAKRAYRLAFLGLALLMLVIATLLSMLATAHRSDAAFVDRSGLERTRSQRIAFLALQLSTTDPALLRTERAELLGETRDLRRGAPAPETAIDAALGQDIARYATAAEAVYARGPQAKDGLATILASRVTLLDEIDRSVRRRAGESATNTDRLVLAIFALLIIEFGAAGLIWRFVIVPYELRQRRGSARMRTFFEGNPDAVAIYALDGTIISGNAAAIELIGYPPRALVGSHFTTHVANEAFEATSAAFERSAAGESVEFETIFIRAGGERRVVLVKLFPSLVGSKIVGVYGVARDVTDLVRARAALAASELRFRSLFEQNPDAVAIIDSTGHYVSVNAAAERLTGIPSSDFVGKTLGTLGLANPEAMKLPPHAMARLLDGKSVDFEFEMVDRNGRTKDIQGKAVPIGDGGVTREFFTIARDVTADRRARKELVESAKRIQELYLVAASSGRSSEQQISSALELGLTRLGYQSGYLLHASDGLVNVTISAGRDLCPNGTSVLLTDTIVSQTIAAETLVAVNDTRDERWCFDSAAVGCAIRSFVAIPIRVGGRIDGAICLASESQRSTPLTPSDRDFVQLVAALVGSAIERGRQRAKLDALAFFDALTGLPNRVLLDDRINELIGAARLHGRSFAVLFVDLDGFKAINDRHGHGAGDDVLRIVSQRLSISVSQTDTVARLGGDEFVILLPHAAEMDVAIERAKLVIAALREPYIVGGRRLELGASIGIACYPEHGLDAHTLLELADRALYRAKTGGGGRYDIYDRILPKQIAR